MGNFAVQRKSMVESQVLPSDVTDRRILRVMLDVPRELFVPADVRPIAYSDHDLPLAPAGKGRAVRQLLTARVHAKLMQHLDLEAGSVVLDVGCGTGYGAAVLARLAQTVVGLECDADLAAQAARNLASLSVDNVGVVTGPLPAGWESEGPYDAILVEGALTAAPEMLLRQLKDGGRLVAVLSDGGVGKATLWRRSGLHFAPRTLFDAHAAVLPGFERAPEFVF